jgi:hypothetical protein
MVARFELKVWALLFVAVRKDVEINVRIESRYAL